MNAPVREHEPMSYTQEVTLIVLLVGVMLLALACIVIGLTGQAAVDWDGGAGKRGHSDSLYPPKTPPPVGEVVSND